ncbi:MAG: hypothetical protein A2Z99_10680 [Treponema sp. GWB1_62_6]|nr:MAG: hypothetical protein A2Z99_10680 [Treponema sp. GWB1_62_6]OHE62788.1 MAG: hypothetical protein A2Y36_06225 [Treponema sp. GWA1_62_8]OHE63662.1 MAG: hypothetical protein A2001_14175 [Treponema sp. GWC1_61_84]OHE71816.1 MAG: hypothetical protein A2413_04015 [Treponema sp. RIFOXYC1_FULL_61_9]HCM25730.1 hypothetical protein [Treponema sp.]
MRILLVIYGSLDTLSGGYLYDRTLVRHLESRGHAVRVYSQRRKAPYPANIFDNADASLVDEAAAWKPDFILEDELNHPSLFLLNHRLRRAARAPLIGIVHHLKSLEEGGVLERATARWIERRFLGSLDGFVFNSSFTRRSVEEALRADSGDGRAAAALKRSVIALPGKDRLSPVHEPAPAPVPAPVPESTTERRGRGNRLRLLFLGNVIRRKGLHVLIQALSPLSGTSRSCTLAVAGDEGIDEDYTASVKMAIRKAGMEERVHWLGSVADADLPRIFQEHDLLAVPSQCEGFGIVYAEAMSYGLPVIAGTLGGAAEIIDAGKDGFLVRWEDAPALAALLAALADHPERLGELADHARKKAATLPTWNDSMERIEEFLAAFPRGGENDTEAT